ncbi:MAG: SpoIIIAH-like family protein, partial [Peptococcaceae bacterium]|nr:SpoIIIAH-like family protein [Peptococcaceae bacterium]
MKTWKKNLVAAAVLVTVCAGIYVNWLYTQEQAAVNLEDTLDTDKILASDTLVMNDGTLLDAASENDGTTFTDYFAAVRLSRQEARDSAVG